MKGLNAKFVEKISYSTNEEGLYEGEESIELGMSCNLLQMLDRPSYMTDRPFTDQIPSPHSYRR